MSVNENRIKKFKNLGNSKDELRRRRAEVTVELRKAKKSDQLLKRRQVDESEFTSPLKDEAQAEKPNLTVEQILAAVQSTDVQQQFVATQVARRMLSRERRPPIQPFIDNGIVPFFIKFLELDSNPELQFEAAWALTNIASGTCEQTKFVVNAGAMPQFVRLLGSPLLNVSEQAVWALGNIAGDGPDLRDLVIKAGAVAPLLRLAKPNSNVAPAFLRNVTWALSNLVRNKNPPADYEVIKQVLPVFSELLRYHDKDVLADCCWAVSYISDGSNDRIQEVVDGGFILRLIELLKSGHIPVVTPALRCLGNIVTGNDAQTQAVVDAGVLPYFKVLLKHYRNNIQKEAAWTISNVTAGNTAQIQAVIDAGLVAPLVDLLHKGDYKTQRETVWAVTNFTSGATPEQCAFLMQSDVIPPLCNMLTCKESRVVLLVMDALTNLLMVAEKFDQLEVACIAIEEAGGLDKIEALQQHPNDDVYQAAITMVERFFSEDEDTAEGFAPQADQAGYQFEQQTVPDGGFKFE